MILQLGEVGGDGVESVEGRLEVVGAELRHAGEYLCVATSHQGSINTSIALSVIGESSSIQSVIFCTTPVLYMFSQLCKSCTVPLYFTVYFT